MTTPQINLGDLIDRRLPLDRPAIIDLLNPAQPRSYTHQQIDQLAGGVAHYLQQQGYPRGSSIAIASLNRAEYIATYFGIMRAGLVAVPLNIKVPVDTLHYFIADASIQLAFVDHERQALLAGVVPLINFDQTDAGGFAQRIQPQDFASVEPQANELAMMLYTSGSTGRPKGVPLTHAGQRWALEATRFGGVEVDGAQDRYLVAQPLFHMNGLFLTKRVFAANGLLVVLPAFNIDSYLRALSDYRINIVTAVPTMFARLLRDPGLLAQYDFSALRKVMLGSAPMTLALLDRIKTAFPAIQISHGYGTTEAGPAVFGPHPQGIPTPPLALGYPLAQGEVELIGDDAPLSGVLRMRNPAVTPGYHRLAAKSAQVLEHGWYNSGDVMRRDEQGFYYFVGRADDMFVCSGENIYPVEVEKTLEAHPLVRQVCVVPLPDEERSQVPVAFVVLQPGSQLSVEELKQHALRLAPAYQHPRRIAFVSELPWAGTNKVDRNALLNYARQLEQQNGWLNSDIAVAGYR
ncbi:acyl--CoA ligase [Erwiniaceae bacterium BAC15a-03b]|uniref:Acyl--CoA ligase n=1 Tax=Winslowiella arboricola TaxID=2978220 RepID=A0A9J6PVU4_9GAMM|nr:class I adenylate-forming enzyme family protein [Winslowiella arboricola]MCU5775518.1 acyl--CoA ligase [Winslowiella arboricola]MCU5779632.1 acyl--CoA ligase [Winslowiella arboricola]